MWKSLGSYERSWSEADWFSPLLFALRVFVVMLWSDCSFKLIAKRAGNREIIPTDFTDQGCGPERLL